MSSSFYDKGIFYLTFAQEENILKNVKQIPCWFLFLTGEVTASPHLTLILHPKALFFNPFFYRRGVFSLC